MKIENIKLYPDRNDVILTSYVHEESRELMGNRKRPAVVVCPGGAYLMCSDREAEPVALRFVAMGYHAFVLRYSTYFGFGGYNFNFTEMKPIPEIQFPAPIYDLGKAMLYIKEHTEECHVDEDKIVIVGGSAGGHLAAMYAIGWYKPMLSEQFKESTEKFRPAAAVLCYPITDFVVMKQFMASKARQEQQELFRISNMIIMGTGEPTDALLEEISPARQVSEKTPPMFIWATGTDELVPVQQSLLLAAALADKNIPFEIHVFEEGVHGLSLATQASAGAKTQINVNAAKWVDLAEAWLMKRFALDVPVESQMPNMFR
jgi:acetyl esterase/lipase